jgi:NAD(P)-dependent dehydrogenase (short-subunit alcohol dehydrogenase family)
MTATPEPRKVAIITGASHDAVVGRRTRVTRSTCQRGLARCHPNARARQSSYAELAGLHPLERVGEIADVVEGVLYLEQASFVTGETLHIDGGQAAGH